MWPHRWLNCSSCIHRRISHLNNAVETFFLFDIHIPCVHERYRCPIKLLFLILYFFLLHEIMIFQCICIIQLLHYKLIGVCNMCFLMLLEQVNTMDPISQHIKIYVEIFCNDFVMQSNQCVV